MGTSIPQGASALLVAVVGILGILTAVGFAAPANTPTETVSATDTLTVNYSSESSLSADPVQEYVNVTVKNSTGAVLDNLTDYQFKPSTGNISWFNTSATTEGNQSTARYNYTRHPRETRTVLSILDRVAFVLSYLPWIVGAIAVVAGVATWAFRMGSMRSGGGGRRL